jgi:cysteine-rich repeat protein
MSDTEMRGGRATNKARARLRRVGLLLPLTYLAASFACSSGHKRPGDLGTGLDLDHSLDAGGAGLWNPDQTPDAGSGLPDEPSLSEDAGTGDVGPNLCGNGVLDPGEDCESSLDLTETCLSRGFDTGALACGADCRFDSTGCSGVENCYDGRDNDGDGLVDCADTAECASSCAEPCLAPPVIAENATVTGSTRGRTAMLGTSCSEAAPSGPDVAYQIHVSEDSKLDVRLSSTQALNLSLRSSCSDEQSELVCSSQTRLTLDALAGETYFVVVDGESASDSGNYTLEVHSRQVVCGDGIRDDAEECDDHNLVDDDGCDSDCNLEPSESEPNNQRVSSDNYNASDPWIAEIGSNGDVDYYRVNVPTAPGNIVVRTFDLGDNACAYNLMDTVVEILDINARNNALLVSDDDSGVGLCSLAVASGLTTGNYFVRVKAADGASPPTFPYRLDIGVGACGDGIKSLAEGCDDGTLVAGDGCDVNCEAEEPHG